MQTLFVYSNQPWFVLLFSPSEAGTPFKFFGSSSSEAKKESLQSYDWLFASRQITHRKGYAHMGQNLTTRAKISLAIISLFLPVALAGCGGTSNSSPSTGVYECQENAATYGVNCFYGNVARTGSDVSTAEAAQFRAGKPFEYRIQDPNGADTYKASLTKQQGSLSTSNFNLSGTIFHTVVTSLATGVVTQTIDVVIDPKAYGVEVTIPGQPAFSETATTSISSMIQDDAAFTPSYLRHVVGDISGDTANASVNY